MFLHPVGGFQFPSTRRKEHVYWGAGMEFRSSGSELPFFHSAKGAQLPSAGSFFSQSLKMRGSPLGREQQLATFPGTFPIDFMEKLANKIANGNHIITGHLATSCKWEQVTNHSNHVGSGSLTCYKGWKCFTRGHCNFEWLLNQQSYLEEYQYSVIWEDFPLVQ